MIRRITFITIILAIIAVLAVTQDSWAWFNWNWKPQPVYSYGGLSVDWGRRDDRLFVVRNMMPGDTVTKKVKVSNKSPTDMHIALWSDETSSPTIFPDILEITISKNADILYGPVTLKQFFLDGQSQDGIPLSAIDEDKSATYTFRVYFPHESGNEYQNLTVVFDLKIGVKHISKDQPCKTKRGKHGQYCVIEDTQTRDFWRRF